MLISEIFSSLQGEGPWTGLPAVFIRLAGCVEPLCPWCDTSHALS
ncbi:MAG: 7-carboxy-7-deazaguanine synthase QueE, partial [Desulfomonilia bacterium]